MPPTNDCLFHADIASGMGMPLIHVSTKYEVKQAASAIAGAARLNLAYRFAEAQKENVNDPGSSYGADDAGRDRSDN